MNAYFTEAPSQRTRPLFLRSRDLREAMRPLGAIDDSRLQEKPARFFRSALIFRQSCVAKSAEASPSRPILGQCARRIVRPCSCGGPSHACILCYLLAELDQRWPETPASQSVEVMVGPPYRLDENTLFVRAIIDAAREWRTSAIILQCWVFRRLPDSASHTAICTRLMSASASKRFPQFRRHTIVRCFRCCVDSLAN